MIERLPRILSRTDYPEQGDDFRSRSIQGLGRLRVRHPAKAALDLSKPARTLLVVGAVGPEHRHELINPPRSRFQPITIDSVRFVVQERITRLSEVAAQSPKVLPRPRILRAR